MTAPTKIGKYEIRHQIGRGAMGVVHEGFDPVIERRVAIKTLRLDIFDPSQTADVLARFKREAQSAGQLAHPHIVTVYEYGEHEGTPYIAMEYLAGNELSKILGRGSRLPLSEVVRLMTQLLGALSYAHERKVVHRDVKPGNIFILDDGSLKVVDFGLAHVEASNLTDTGALLGTPAYMSPEQFLAQPVDERSDIFSAGVILYELLTGDKPFTGSVTSIMQKVLHQDPLEPSVLNPMLSAAWNTVVKRAIAKKPEARFQSARQFSETIKQVFDKSALNVSVEVMLPGRHTAADLGGETLRPSAEEHKASKKQRPVPPASAEPEIAAVENSSKKGLAISAIAIVAVLGITTFYMSHRSRDDLAKQEPSTKSVQQTDVAAERVAADKAAAEAKVAAEKAAAESEAMKMKTAQISKLAEERTMQEKAAEMKKAAEKAAQEKAATEKKKVIADKIALEKAEAAKRVAERAAIEEAAAANRKALAERQAAEKAEADRAATEAARSKATAVAKSDQREETIALVRSGTWFGQYSCGSFNSKLPPPPPPGNPAPLSLPVSMTVKSSTATIVNESDFTRETLVGTIDSSGALVLEGGGIWKNGKSEQWITRFAGKLDGSRYKGTGARISFDGKTKLRDCALDLRWIGRAIE